MNEDKWRWWGWIYRYSSEQREKETCIKLILSGDLLFRWKKKRGGSKYRRRRENRIYRNRTNTFFNFLHTRVSLSLCHAKVKWKNILTRSFKWRNEGEWKEVGVKIFWWIFPKKCVAIRDLNFFLHFHTQQKTFRYILLIPPEKIPSPIWIMCERHKWATTWDDFPSSSSNCAQRIEFFSLLFFVLMRWNFPLPLHLFAFDSATTQAAGTFFFAQLYDLCDYYCFSK